MKLAEPIPADTKRSKFEFFTAGRLASRTYHTWTQAPLQKWEHGPCITPTSLKSTLVLACPFLRGPEARPRHFAFNESKICPRSDAKMH